MRAVNSTVKLGWVLAAGSTPCNVTGAVQLLYIQLAVFDILYIYRTYTTLNKNIFTIQPSPRTQYCLQTVIVIQLSRVVP